MSQTNKFFHDLIHNCDALFRRFCKHPDCKPDNYTWKVYLQQYYFWKFSPKVKRCSQFIDLKGFLIASRNDVGGKNPSVRTKQSFSPSRCYFECEILAMGRWIAIGCAPISFALSNYYVCGSSSCEVNTGLYSGTSSQGAYIKLMGRKRKTLSRLQDHDRVGIWVEHKKNQITFFLNDKKLCSVPLELTDALLLYPTVSLGYGTSCRILPKFEPQYLEAATEETKKKNFFEVLKQKLLQTFPHKSKPVVANVNEPLN